MPLTDLLTDALEGLESVEEIVLEVDSLDYKEISCIVLYKIKHVSLHFSEILVINCLIGKLIEVRNFLNVEKDPLQ